jgi:hypothetical protein
LYFPAANLQAYFLRRSPRTARQFHFLLAQRRFLRHQLPQETLLAADPPFAHRAHQHIGPTPVLLPKQEQFVEIAFPIAHAHNLVLQRQFLHACSGGFKPTQPLHAFFLFDPLAIDRGLALAGAAEGTTCLELRVEHSETLPLRGERQGAVQEQPLGLAAAPNGS